MKKALTSAVACLWCGATAMASVSDLIDDSIGYQNIRDGVVMIETETGGSFCKIDIGDEVFAEFAEGGDISGYVAICVPYDVFNGNFVSSDDRSFTDCIDASEGYTHVREGVILVEESAVSSLCQITISDDDFARFASEGKSGVQDARAVCVSIEELEN
ncbi:hypothetical protein So717_03170 [Roseobacter cerasinus]|uniref:Uncharacterized protein n=1 Tax=Roseobacter cerasinus TaxID=2602289 RepID=A0A640VLS0_9RHOB|nr:hypothetical protein [Roseobacter cerasinus]GFE48564.1 hypothetical protein So717_03170 [Roseobacter cerasinus]